VPTPVNTVLYHSLLHLLTSLWTHVGRNSSPPLPEHFLAYIMRLQKEF